MRNEMHNARLHLLESLSQTPSVISVQHDDSDFVMADLDGGKKVILYIVESAISLHEIKQMIKRHTENGWYTLFVFWCDMLLPNDGEWFIAHDWMAALLPLYNGCIYGFDVNPKREMIVFPVYFESQPPYKESLIRYGMPVSFAELRCREIQTDFLSIAGSWRIADFQGEQPTSPTGTIFRSTLQIYYNVLEITADADLETIKSAYRQLARRYHPDVNPAPEAHEQMQKINEAYTKILGNLPRED